MLLKKDILKQVYPKRKFNARKYDYGALLIIGGSEKYSGSPAFNALAALAAYRSGADIVEVIAPRRSAGIIATFSPDIITIPLEGEYVSKKHLKTLFEETKNKTAVVIGGGIEREKDTQKTIIKYLKKINLPVVIDADAIYALANEKSIIKSNFVITPHAHEFFILTGINLEEFTVNQKIAAVRDSALKLKCTILLKGNPDIISNGKQNAINKTGNRFMTVGGTGDTLAGICGSLLAQGINPFKAACAAAYINGKAGDVAAKKKKQSMLASDLIQAISDVIA